MSLSGPLDHAPPEIDIVGNSGRRQNLTVEYKKPILFYFYSLFIACGLILLSLELFLIVVNCKIVNISVKFKFIHKISIIHEKFLVFFNLLRGPDITPLG